MYCCYFRFISQSYEAFLAFLLIFYFRYNFHYIELDGTDLDDDEAHLEIRSCSVNKVSREHQVISDELQEWVRDYLGGLENEGYM